MYSEIRKKPGKAVSIIVTAAMICSLFVYMPASAANTLLGAQQSPSSGAPATRAGQAELQVSDLTVEYMKTPIGVDRQKPVFSWKIDKGDIRGIVQTSYRISVRDGDETVWDSGSVESDLASGIEYGGEALSAATKYIWTVDVTDNQGGAASSISEFGTGLYEEDDWNDAQWISNIGGTGSVGSADPAKYTVEADFTLEAGSFGLMLGENVNNFFMYQVNAATDGANVYVRPHRWVNGGGAAIGHYNTGISAPAFLGAEHKLRLEIDSGTVKAYMDGELLTYEGEEVFSSQYIGELSGIGVRAYYNPNNSDKDNIKINKLEMRNSLGDLVYYDDFTGTNSFDRGVVEDGQLVIHPEGSGNIEWRVWQKPADSKVFSVQTDVQVGDCAAGFAFGVQDSSHFYMWQLNTFNYPSTSTPEADKLTYLRPHVWNGGPTEYGNDVNINAIVSKAEADSGQTALRVDVNNGALVSYVNGIKVDERSSGRSYDIGSVGFRHSKDRDADVEERGIFDNIMLRDAGGRVVLFDDFEDGINMYEGTSIEDGRLVVKRDGSREIILRDSSAAQQGASQVPMFRKDFQTDDKDIVRATVYASALGHYELQMNGAKVGEDYMAPGWTEYDTRVQYQAYDVTKQVIKGGENALGAMLAPGWYSGNISILGDKIYGSKRAVIVNLVIEYADGSKQSVVTDGTWKYTLDGPIIDTDMFDGETYDANRELGGSKYAWAAPDFDNSGWNTAGVMFDSAFSVKTEVSGDQPIELTAQVGPTVKKIKDVNPISINVVGGKYIVDMGQNFAGILNISLKGEAGSTAVIRYGEMLNDGPQGQRGNDNPDGAGSLYTANLRSAKATDRYTFKSNEKETWEPNFTFHGFRYVEISGVSEAPALADVRGIALANAMEETGSFDSSNELLNKIYNNSFWGQRSNFLSVPTDCPQRDERMGWGADTHVFAGTGMFNMDASMFYQKWLLDMRDGQYADGRYGDTAPNPHNFAGDIVWNAGGVIVPYTIWQRTGDTRVLEDSYTSMSRYMAGRMSMGNIQSCGYGDWLEPVDGTSDKNVIGTAYFAYQLSLMAEMADALGKSEDAAAYRARFSQVNNAFHSAYVSPDGTISNGIQSGYVLALGTGLTKPETEQLFVQKLVDKIEADGNLMTVGFVSVNKLMPVLTKYGHSDIAYQLALNTAYPSWGYSIEQGATTGWERWNSYTLSGGFGPVSMNSFNHYAFGSVSEWFYNGVAGINTDPQNPGFKNIIIEPALDGRLSYAKASYDSIRGEIVSGWTRQGENSYKLDVVVPANATATVVLPAPLAAVEEGGLAIVDGDGRIQPQGVSGAEDAAAKARISVGSGSYSFTFDWDATVIKTGLQAALTAVRAAVAVEEDFTEDSVLNVKSAIGAALLLLDKADATQTEIDEAEAALNTAAAGLESSGNVNLARGKTATVSSQVTSDGIFSKQKLTDGTRSGGGDTTWSSNDNRSVNHTEWAMIDLGETTRFNRILLFPRDDSSAAAHSGWGFPNSFTIETSADGETWQTVISRTDQAFVGTAVQRFTIPAQEARFVRVTGTSLNKVGNDYHMQLAEIEIYRIEAAATSAELINMQTEYAVNPMGIDVAAPRLSWNITSDLRGVKQEGYRIVVTKGAPDGPIVWTVDEDSDNTLGVKYAGTRLEPSTRYYWKVTARTNVGAAVGENAWFETGLMNNKIGAWDGAQWLTEPASASNNDVSDYTIEYDFKMIKDGGGLIFASNGSNFLMWQFNINPVERPYGGTPYFRPHRWNPGGSSLAEIKIDNVIPDNEEGKHAWYHCRIEVKKNGDAAVVTTSLGPLGGDMTVIDNARNIAGSWTLGKIGFRQIVDVNNQEEIVYDNIVIRDNTDGGDAVIYSETFETEPTSMFGVNGTVEDGAYRVRGVTFTSSRKVVDPVPLDGGEPLFRKEFGIDKTVKSARLYATARGYYEFSLNGEKVGDQYLAPGWTDYNYTVMYQIYDVTNMLKPGANAIGAMLGMGWFSGPNQIYGYNMYGSTQSLLGKLVIEYTDGSSETLVTDGSWKYRPGPILYADNYAGETYDARYDCAGWNTAGYDDSAWQDAGIHSPLPAGADLVPQTGPPVREVERFENPVMTEPVPGKYTYDFGQNIAGIVSIKVKGTAGTKITIKHGEMLNTETAYMNPGEASVKGGDGPIGTVYRANLRDQQVPVAYDYYILKGDPNGEEYTPRFTFHGFRYIEISGIDEAIPPEDVTAIAISSDNILTSSFESSNPKVNQLYSNIIWGMRGNFVSIPTDCPNRDERLGYTGDTQIFAGTGVYLANTDQFYAKWLRDLRSYQMNEEASGRDKGLVPVLIPAVRVSAFTNWSNAWGDGAVIVPWQVYQQYGDTQIIRDSFDSMKAWCDFLNDPVRSTDYIRISGGVPRDNNYGDWVSVEDSPHSMTDTLFTAYSNKLFAKMARAIGETDTADTYDGITRNIVNAFMNAFRNADGSLKASTQTPYGMLLYFGLADEVDQSLYAELLAENIRNHGWKLTSGFIGVSYLAPALSQNGQSEAAFKLLEQEEYPSWIYSINQGATTTWERWNSYTIADGFGPTGMNSFNHYAFGSIGEWMFSGVLGIRRDEAAPGFRHFILDPQYGGTLTYANGGYDSVSGRIDSGWTWNHDTGAFNYDFTIPANTTATVYIPTLDPANVTEGSEAAGEAEGVVFVSYDSELQRAEYEVASGAYSFSSAVRTESDVLDVSVVTDTVDVFGEIIPGFETGSNRAQKIPASFAANAGDTFTLEVRPYNDVDFVFDKWSDSETEYTDNPIRFEGISESKELTVSFKNIGLKSILLGAAVTAQASHTSSATGEWGRNNLVDGWLTSRDGRSGWTSAIVGERPTGANIPILTFDMGEKKSFNRIQLYPRTNAFTVDGGTAGFPRDFTIEGSDDGENWTIIQTETDVVARYLAPYVITFDTQTWRYIRIVCTRIGAAAGDDGGGRNYRMQLAEFGAYYENDYDEEFDFDIALNKAEKAVRVTGTGFTPGKNVSLLAAYNFAPDSENSDFSTTLTADADGNIDFTLPAAVTEQAPWLGGHSYYISINGVTDSAAIYATKAKVHTSARVSVRLRQTLQLNYDIDGAAYEFVSSNPAVATVDAEGIVTAKKAGTATLTLRATDGSGLISTAMITVTP
ncbi:MAG: family 78 glycoside hydrolase catalytic domain [Clostridiales Family XIII bacterium]|nr:family 78 glycoside hydrolase catalytic domain [Clostridiales Family XIII bacterium]